MDILINKQKSRMQTKQNNTWGEKTGKAYTRIVKQISLSNKIWFFIHFVWFLNFLEQADDIWCCSHGSAHMTFGRGHSSLPHGPTSMYRLDFFFDKHCCRAILSPFLNDLPFYLVLCTLYTHPPSQYVTQLINCKTQIHKRAAI